MSTKKREVIFGGRIMGAKIRAEHARELAKKAQRDADRAEAELWSIRMEAYGGPAQPSPTIAQCLNEGLGWLEVENPRPFTVIFTHRTCGKPGRICRDAHDAAQLTSRYCQQAGAWRCVRGGKITQRLERDLLRG